jgi:hypothetical protein
MKPSRSTEEIIGILRKQEAGAKATDVSRKYGISSAPLLQMEGQVRRWLWGAENMNRCHPV